MIDKLKRFILTILTVSIQFIASSQDVSKELVLIANSDTSYYEFHMERVDSFQLTDIKYQSDDFVFRSFNPVSVLTIKANDGEIIGEITFRVFEVDEDKLNPSSFTRTYKMPSEHAKNMHNYIIESGIIDLPSDKYINGWEQNGLDGITYTFEYKIENQYSIKHYWTPSSQEQLTEAKLVLGFNKRLIEVGNLGHYGELFASENPYSAYTYYGVSYSVVKIRTKDQMKKERKVKRNKRKHDPR